MKFNKKNKCWIMEEIEKKDEVVVSPELVPNEFGGENPEDVEKQREENDKIINKRFDKTKKNGEKVVGEDHEEKGKPMKEYLKTRVDLSNLLRELKEKNCHYTISKSDKENYRYLVEYFEDRKSFKYRGIQVQFNEGKYLASFDDGELVESTNRKEIKESINNKLNEKLVEDDIELLELPEDELLTEPLPDAIPEEPIVISTEVPEDVEENAIYLALSSELRDILGDIENLKSLVVTLAENGDEEIINNLNDIIDDRTIHVGLIQGLMDKYNTEVSVEEHPKEEVEVVDIEEPEIKEESLNEDCEDNLDDVENGICIAYGKAGLETIRDAKERNYYIEYTKEDSAGEPRYRFVIDKTRNYDGTPKQVKESLNEDHVTNEYKGYELDWNSDSLDVENANVDFTVSIKKNGEEVATAKGFKEARKWIDDNGEQEETIHLDKYEVEESDDADKKADVEIMPYGEVTKSQWEDFLNKAKWPYWLDWESLVNEVVYENKVLEKLNKETK